MKEKPLSSSSSGASKFRLLRTKTFIPRVRPDLVPRSRLLSRLDAGPNCRLTLVSAPAGFGKTTLLADWTQKCRSKVTWVSLDPADNDLHRFWAYVALALGNIEPHLGQAALAVLQSPRPPHIQAILTDLINEITTVAERFVLVLDDYHVVESSPVHDSLAFFLQNLPPPLHLIISSRQDLPLPLAALRSRGQLSEVRAEDLRFTREETTTFLNRIMGLELRPADVAALEDRIEGWAAGLQLAALSMQGEKDLAGFIRSFTGSHRYVFDYLAQEVLQRQDQPTRAFLLQTSILERLNGPLCDALTGSSDASAALRRLEQANLFLVPLDQERQFYRYHHLFADFLRVQLQQEYGLAHAADLHRRAAGWYEQNGWIEEAVNHLAEAQDYPNLARVIDQAVVEMFDRSELSTLLNWMEKLPASEMAAHSRLCAAAAWGYMATGRSDKIEVYLESIERALGVSAEVLANPADAERLPPEVRGALCEVTVLRASRAVSAMDIPRIFELSRRVLPFLTPEAPTCLFNQPAGLRPAVFLNLAVAHEFSGNVTAAIEAYEETAASCREYKNFHVLPVAQSRLAQLLIVKGQLYRAAEIYRHALREAQEMVAQLSPLAGTAHAGLGNLMYEWNDLEGAFSHLLQAIAMGKPWNNWESLVPGYIGMARLKASQGDLTGAMETLQELVRLSQDFEMTSAMPLIQVYRARLDLAQNKLDDAARWADNLGFTAEQPVALLREPEAIMAARVWIAQGRLEQAVQFLDRLLKGAAEGEHAGRMVEILVLQSLAQQAQGHLAEALAALGQALELAQPGGYIRTFADEGAPMRSMLAQLRADAAERAPGTDFLGYIDRVLAAFQTPKAAAKSANPEVKPGTLAEPLSEREMQVLRLLAAGLTNQQIAERLIVSPNTVKTHVKNIFGKLQAGNRPQAIARARQLDLL